MSSIFDLILGRKNAKMTSDVFANHGSQLFPRLYGKTVAKKVQSDAIEERKAEDRVHQLNAARDAKELKAKAALTYKTINAMVLEVCKLFAHAAGSSPESVKSEFVDRSDCYAIWSDLGINGIHYEFKHTWVMLDYDAKFGDFFFRVRSHIEIGDSDDVYFFNFDECTQDITRESLIGVLKKLSETV